MQFCFTSIEERSMELAGDAIVSSPKVVTNHGIKIASPAAEVWPWLVQLGQNRGGFYSYSWLENLIGCQITNATSIVPHWQNLSIGDEVSLHPKAIKLSVACIKPNRHLVLVQERPIHWTWSFNLIPIPDTNREPQHSDRATSWQKEDLPLDDVKSIGHTCRLLIRTRCAWSGWALTPILFPTMTLGHYAMERKLLTTIKKLCESIPAR